MWFCQLCREKTSSVSPFLMSAILKVNSYWYTPLSVANGRSGWVRLTRVVTYKFWSIWFLINRWIAVSDRDMGARHRARAHSIQIMRIERVPSSKCRRSNIKQFHVRLLTGSRVFLPLFPELRKPLVHRRCPCDVALSIVQILMIVNVSPFSANSYRFESELILKQIVFQFISPRWPYKMGRVSVRPPIFDSILSMLF